MRRSLVLGGVLASLALAMVLVPGRASANGFELPGASTRALGRGDAFVARSDEPTTLLYDPANLADLGGVQLNLNVNNLITHSCATLTGAYPDGTPYPKVCNSGTFAPVPQIAVSWRVTDKVGLGIGIFAPVSPGFSQKFGSSEKGDIPPGLIDVDVNGMTERRAAPTRYQLIEEDLIVLHPTIGIGVALNDRVRVGFAFSSTIVLNKFTTAVAAFGGTDPRNDIVSKINVHDWFVPGITMSIHAVPIDSLDVVAAFIWRDKIRGKGDISLWPLAYRNVGSGMSGMNMNEGFQKFSGARLTAGYPWRLSFGLRYASRIVPRIKDRAAAEKASGKVEDQMKNERWDIEGDIVYSGTSEVDAFVVRPPAGMVSVDGIPIPLPEELTIPHQWRNELSVRVGGDWNVLPGRFTMRAGFSFENGAAPKSLTNLDFQPFRRYGIHAGGTLRIKRTDLSLAYAFFRNENVDLTKTRAALPQIVGVPNTARAVVNAGRYRSWYNVIGGSINVHLR